MAETQPHEGRQSVEGQAMTQALQDATFVDIAHRFVSAQSLLAEVEDLGVVLAIEGDGIVFDASEDVMSSELLERLRAVRSELRELLAERDSAQGTDRSEWQAPGPFVDCRCCNAELPADQANGSACERCAQLELLANSLEAFHQEYETDWDDQSFAELNIPLCETCGLCCDIQRLDDAWKCSRCDTEAEERWKRTHRVLNSVQAIRARQRRLKKGSPGFNPTWYRNRLEEDLRRTGRGVDSLGLIDLAPAKPCPGCGSVQSHAVPIHDGQSIRRDCSGCGQYIDNPVWYDLSAASNWLSKNACHPKGRGPTARRGQAVLDAR
jgi:hypothetical protein